jgi:hypothetical protein
VPLRIARLAAGFVALAALAGCGGGGDRPLARPAPARQTAVDLVHLSRAQATRKAQRVVLARALGSKVIWGPPSAPGTPFTRTRFVVERVLKGHVPRTFVLQVVGGTIGSTSVESPVQAFARRHRYVLFLGPDGPHGPTIFPQSVVELR